MVSHELLEVKRDRDAYRKKAEDLELELRRAAAERDAYKAAAEEAKRADSPAASPIRREDVYSEDVAKAAASLVEIASSSSSDEDDDAVLDAGRWFQLHRLGSCGSDQRKGRQWHLWKRRGSHTAEGVYIAASLVYAVGAWYRGSTEPQEDRRNGRSAEAVVIHQDGAPTLDPARVARYLRSVIEFDPTKRSAIDLVYEVYCEEVNKLLPQGEEWTEML